MRFPLSFRAVVCGLAVASALFVAAGCGKRSAGGDSGAGDRVLHLGNGAEPQDLDPHLITAFTDYTILLALFEGLTALDEKTSQPVPAAAERWEVSPDGRAYTFHLRKNARWSNGDPVTTADHLFAYQRMLTASLASEYSYLLWPVKNAQAYNEGKLGDFSQVGFRALDPHTLEITLENPTPYFLSLLAHQSWFPVHRATIEKHGPLYERGNRWTRAGNHAGNGPFRLTEWSPRQRVVTEKNPHYWDAGVVRLEGMVFYPTENAETDERNFRAGQVHLTYELPLSKIEAYRKNEPQLLRADPFLETFYLRFNTQRPPLDNPKVRQALARALDREAIVRAIVRGGQRPAHHYTPPDTAGYTARARVPTDFEEARRLLGEAGFPGGKGFPALTLVYDTGDINQKILEGVQEMWRRELGIQVNLSNMDRNVWLDAMRTLQYDVSRSRWIGDYADPKTFLDMFVTGGGNNQTGWSHPEYDRLIAESERTLDPAQRHELFQQAEAILLAEAPIAPIFFGTRLFLCRPEVKNWHPSLLGVHQYKYVFLERPAPEGR